MRSLGPAGRIAQAFVHSKLTPLVVLGAMLLGGIAVWKTPREEEPQIVVPMADVIVQMPGATSKEVERRISTPMEKLVWEIPGVEYLYSTSSPGQSLLVVRFQVGQDEERAFVRLREKLQAHFDQIPPGATQPIIKPRSIDDVPILALTVHGGADSETLRQIALRIEDQIKQVPDVSETAIIGGRKRNLKVALDPSLLESRAISPDQVIGAIAASNQHLRVGNYDIANHQAVIESGDFLANVQQVEDVIVAAPHGSPIRVRDVAKVSDEGEEPTSYVQFGTPSSGLQPAVTISIAKRKSVNAIDVVGRVLAKVDSLKGWLIPAAVKIDVTRNYGATASDKSNDLLLHMFIAIISVTLLIAIALGFKESLVVLIAIPATLGLTLLVFYIYGYTLNRITLFALIFSIGILVDDAIVGVENIVRHRRMPENKGRAAALVAAEAVDEVGNPTILATFTVIAAILPMGFVGGLMGPYMRPIPVGATAAMLFSLFIAFAVTPWAAIKLIKEHGSAKHVEGKKDRMTRLYEQIMRPLLRSAGVRWGFLGGIILLLLGACALVAAKLVIVKMLPFDNKSEFQVVIDMPTGTSLERTLAVAQKLAAKVNNDPYVHDLQIYAGTASPYNFNGLVRHYFARVGSNQADIQVNLVEKGDRNLQSHAIAKRIRAAIAPLAIEEGARIKVAEVPPGPPVLETLVAEVFGPDEKSRLESALAVKKVFSETAGITDVDWYVDDDQQTIQFVVDKEKAARSGVNTGAINRTLQAAVAGTQVGLLHDVEAREDVPLLVRLPRIERSSLERLARLRIPGANGQNIPLSEIAHPVEIPTDKSIFHKNLQPVVYVVGDVFGRQESPVYAITEMNSTIEKLRNADGSRIEIISTHQPESTKLPIIKWDGEWHITYEVFRDLGMAFAVVLVLIYILVVAWFQDFKIPLVIMAPIPLTLIGILPGHALMGAFFTATSMIGFIAGAGIIVRNSIILVDFIRFKQRQGTPLEEAVIEAGATRFRPMLLTAAAVMVGSSVILFDPIFQGLAIALIAGEVASTLISRFAVPVLYFMLERKAAQAE